MSTSPVGEGPGDTREASSEEFGRLVKWAAGLRLREIPAGVLRRAATILLDDVGAMVAPHAEPEVQRFVQRFAPHRPGGESTVFLDGRRVPRLQAATANAAACCWCQLDEGFRKTSCHAGLYVLPALLAEAEAADLSVGEVLRCLVGAYEVVTRVATAWTRTGSPHHVHAAFSGVGAASAVGLARNLEASVLGDAIAAAATLSPVGPLAQMVDGALVSNFYASMGAQAGMQAVDWAQIGIGGHLSALDDVYRATRGATHLPGRLSEALGEVWSVNFGFHKWYAACQRLHAGADAVLALLARMPDHERGRRIRGMVIRTHDPQLAAREPRNSLATRFSFPHALAAMAVLGHGRADAFGAATLDDPDIVALRARVQVLPYDPPQAWPNDRAVHIAVTMDDDSVYEEECRLARGSPDRPLSEAEIVEKAESLASPVFPSMVCVLRRVLDSPESAAPLPWRQVVREMSSPSSAGGA